LFTTISKANALNCDRCHGQQPRSSLPTGLEQKIDVVQRKLAPEHNRTNLKGFEIAVW